MFNVKTLPRQMWISTGILTSAVSLFRSNIQDAIERAMGYCQILSVMNQNLQLCTFSDCYSLSPYLFRDQLN